MPRKAKSRNAKLPVPRAPRQPVTIHYRKLSDPTEAFADRSLEEAIRAAFAHTYEGHSVAGLCRLRARVIPPSNEDTTLINLFRDGQRWFFGDLTCFTKGTLQALLDALADQPTLSVEQVAPPNGKEALQSIMYWLATGNHVLLIQTKALVAKDLEEYFTWLLKDRAAVVGPAGQVILQARFDPDEVGELTDVTEIEIGGSTSLAPIPPKQEVKEVDQYTHVAERRPWRERARAVLMAVMDNEADVTRLLDQLPEGADLQVSVVIGYKTKRKRLVSRAPMQEALRNLPEGEIRARGRYGKQKGKDLRISYPASVLKIGSLLDPSDALRALLEAYQHLVDNGKIEP